MTTDNPIEQLEPRATRAIKELLSDKHLYQSIAIDVGFLDVMARHQLALAESIAARPSMLGAPARHVDSLDQFRTKLNKVLQMGWHVCLPNQSVPPMASKTSGEIESPRVRLPTIKTVCANQNCGEKGPFNPIEVVTTNCRPQGSDQSFYLTYQCQNCIGSPVHFLIRRRGIKLTLCGRDPMEEVEVASVIPKANAKHLRDAMVAHNSGQTLRRVLKL